MCTRRTQRPRLDPGLSTPPPLTPPAGPTDELIRIERRRKAAIRQRRHARVRGFLAVAAIAGAGVGGFYLGRALTEAPGQQLTTSDHSLGRVTVTETVAARTVTVVTRGNP
jgi:hypothetical protein